MEFCEAIRIIRKKSLLSQDNFAKAIGVSFSTINRWENAKSIPKISKLKQINDFCKINNIPFNVEDYLFQNESLSEETEKCDAY